MNKFYLTWSEEEPIHPKEVYKQGWNTGILFHGQINPPDKSLKSALSKAEDLMIMDGLFITEPKRFHVDD